MSSTSTQKPRRSMSEIINEQFNGSDLQRGREEDAWDDLGGDGPQIDEYHEGGGHDDDDDGDRTDSAARAKGASMQVGKRSRAGRLVEREAPKRLRHRGPLDASLSAGDYAATPVDVEAMMDGIFGALEMNDDIDKDFDATHEDENGDDQDDDDDNAVTAANTRRQRRTRSSSKKAVTEEEYIAWLEAQQRKKQSGLHTVGADGEEGDILEQLESLRNAQMELLHREMRDSTATEEGNGESGDNEPYVRQRKLAQEAVRHYVMVYSQLLRVRIKMQPAVARAVAFPQYYALPDFLHHENVQLKADVADLNRSLNDLLGVFYALAVSGNEEERHQTATLSFKDINACHRRMMADVDTCIEYWGSKLMQPNSAKLRTVSQPLLHQIRAVLGSKARLRAKVQKNRSHTTILGHPLHYHALQSAEGKAALALRIAEGNIDEEIYDDTEFLREVVRRGGVSKLEQQLKELQRGLQPGGVPAKRGFHRLTKGKALNYEPRPKLVGFLLPLPYTLEMQHEVMMNSLFQ